MLFRVLSLAILIIFYGIYFTKMFVQKKQGIQTRQIGKCREKDIRTVEMLMSAATLLIVPIQIISIIFDLSVLVGGVRFVGASLGIIGDIFFLIAVVTMKDSWRAGIPSEDKTAIITDGIYKISRNPAFLGFDLMYIGICIIYCNILTIAFSLFAIIMLHFQILSEERYLEKTFGDEYINYKKRVFRYFGRKLGC